MKHTVIEPATVVLTPEERHFPHQYMRWHADCALAACRCHQRTNDDVYLEQAISWKDRFNAVADYVDAHTL